MTIDLEPWQRLAFCTLPVLLDAAVKGIVLLAATGTLVLAMRKTSAAARQAVWLLALAALLALPLASAALPGWQVLPGWARIDMPAGPASADSSGLTANSPPSGPFGGADPAGMYPAPALLPELSQVPQGADVSMVALPAGAPGLAPRQATDAGDSAASTTAPNAANAGKSWRASLVPSAVAIWLAGSLVCLLPLVLGRLSLWRLARRSRRIEGGTWAMLLQRAAKAIGLRRPVALLQSNDEPMPMVWGVLRPRLLLPAEADEWSADRRWVVLLHELAHARRYDCLAKLVAHVACALYWFNPLCWIAFKLMQRESEVACDDLVLSADHASTGLAGLRPSDYAQHLLEIASGLKSGMLAAYSSIAMARQSKLEGRLLAILDGCRNRRRVTIWGFVILALLTASIVIPLSLMKAPAKAGIASRSDYWLASGATFQGVRPDRGDDLYDDEGNPTGIKVECEPEQASWDQDRIMRDFILRFPASEELITPTGPVMISQPGQNDMLAIVYPEVIPGPGGKQLVIVPAGLPREVSKGGFFRGNEPLQSVDFTLRFFHGPRGKAEQTFAGPFAAGQKLQSGGITLEVKRPTQGFGSPGLGFAVSANRLLEVGTPLTVYDKSGKAHPSQYGGGTLWRGRSTIEYRLYGLPLEQIDRIAFNEGSYFIVCRNVRVRYDQLPARSHAPYLDRVAERLGLPAEKAAAISEKGFANPLDAVKCADLVRGESIRQAWQAIESGEPRLKLSALTDEQKDALANVAMKWATQSRKYRPVGVRLGLWCKRAEFVPLAIDLLKGDIDYSGSSEIARSIQAARDLLTDEQVDQLTRLVLKEEDPSVTTLRNVLMTLAARGTSPAAERAVRELAESDKPWLWRPAVGWLAPKEKLGDRSVLSRKMLLRAIAVTAAKPGEEALEAEARKMVGNELTPRFVAVDSSTFAEALRWYASRADKGDGTQCLLGMLRLLVNEWDAHKVEGRASSNWWAVDRSVKYLNFWNGVDIGGLGRDVTQETYSNGSFNWKAIAEQALRWSKTGIDPGNLPAGWKPGDGDIRVVWKNLDDPAMSVIALPPAQEQALGAHLVLTLAKDMLNIRRTETDKLPGLETIAGVMQSHSTRKEFTLQSIPMQLPLGPYMDGSFGVDGNGVRHQTKLWVSSWELWVEPADAAEGCLADTKLFEEWKAAYLTGGGTRAPLARVFSHHDPASTKRLQGVPDQSLRAHRNPKADRVAAAESATQPATAPATQLASEAATTRPAGPNRGETMSQPIASPATDPATQPAP